MLIFDPNFDYKFYDESAAEEEYETPSLDSSLGALIAGFSSRGRHNKIIECRTQAAAKSNFGDDFANFDKYGQANIHAMRLLKSKARVFFCSLCPDDAKVAYSVFGVSVAEDSAIPVYKRTDTVLSEDNTTIVDYGSGSYVLNANGDKQQIELTAVVDTTTAKVGNTYNFTSYNSDNTALATGVAKVTAITDGEATIEVTDNTVEGFVGNSYVVKETKFDSTTKYELYTTDKEDTGMYVLITKGETADGGLTDSGATTKMATVSGVVLKTEVIDIQSNTVFDKDGFPTGYTGEIQTLTDDNGNERKFYPLFLVYYYSKGKGGNNFAYHIERQTSRDKKSTDGRRYTMYFYEMLSTGTYRAMYDGEDFNFSFNENAVYSSTDNTSEALDKVYVNLDSASDYNPIQMITFPENYDSLLDTIVAAGASEEDSKYDIDVLNLIFKNGNPYNKIVSAPGSIDLDNTYVTLDHGTDGSLDVGTYLDNKVLVTEEIAAKTKEQLLVDFFSCNIDDDIFDEKITDIDILPDENYSDIVKQTIMGTFSQYRPDIHLGMDLGITKTPEEAISRTREISTYVNSEWSFMVSIYGQAGLLQDKAIDGTPREVTATYDWAAGLADNFSSAAGAFQMRAGSKRGRVSYFKPYWIGKKNKQNTLETLEELHINNIQYLNKQKELVYMLEDTQYEVENSKMLSVRNSIVVGRLIRICAGILPYYKYDTDNIDTTMANAKADLEKATINANIPATIKVSYNLYQTKADKKEENAHVGIDVEFPNYIKKFHVEIRAKRQSTTEQ